MSQQWIRGPVCGVDNCPSRLYKSLDGQKICQFGHVLEGDFEFNDDDGDFVQTRRLQLKVNEVGNLVHKSQVQQEKRSVKKLSGNQAREVVLRCLQVILKSQVNAVVKELYGNDEKFKQELEMVVKLNWIRLLEYYMRDDSVKDDDIKFQVKQNTKLPLINDTIFLVYYSILQLNYYPIYLPDMVRLLASNKFPAIRTKHVLPEKYLSRIGKEYHTSIEMNFLSDELFYRYYKKTAKRLRIKNLAKPVDFYHNYIFKTFMETLLLPNSIELFCLTDSLLRKVDMPILFPKLTTQVIIPDVTIACFMIFVIKVHFIFLNNKINYQEWLTNIKRLESDDDKVDFFNKDHLESANTLVNWSENKINNYCNYLNEVYLQYNIKSRSTSNQNTIMMDRLFQIFDTQEPEPESETSNLNDYIKSYTTKDLKRVNVKDVYIIEDFLFNKLSKSFLMSTDKFYHHYEFVESVIDKALNKLNL